MPQQVLDLDGDVVAELREFAVQRLDDGQRVRRPIEEIGIAEGDVLGARIDLAANVFQHDVALHDAENSVVDGHNGAMAAKVFAAAAGFRIAGDLESAFRHQQVRVLRSAGRPLRSGGMKFRRSSEIAPREPLAALAVLCFDAFLLAPLRGFAAASLPCGLRRPLRHRQAA